LVLPVGADRLVVLWVSLMWPVGKGKRNGELSRIQGLEQMARGREAARAVPLVFGLFWRIFL
jgi:hypothetical protein